MSIRRRAIKARVERDRKRKDAYDAMSASLARMKVVIDGAIADGRTELSEQEWSQRLNAAALGVSP